MRPNFEPIKSPTRIRSEGQQLRCDRQRRKRDRMQGRDIERADKYGERMHCD